MSMVCILSKYSYAHEDIAYLNVIKVVYDEMKAMVGSLHTLKQVNRTN